MRDLLPHQRISNDLLPRRQWRQASHAAVEPVDYEVVSMMTTEITRNLGENGLVATVNHTIEHGLVVPHLRKGEPDICFGEVDVV